MIIFSGHSIRMHTFARIAKKSSGLTKIPDVLIRSFRHVRHLLHVFHFPFSPGSVPPRPAGRPGYRSRPMIHVKRNVTHPQRNQPEITTPKTKAGIRTIPIIKPLQQVLTPSLKSGYIVGGESPLTLSAYRAMWYRITKTIDMHGATPHTLRHSYLTYAVGATTDFNNTRYLRAC